MNDFYDAVRTGATVITRDAQGNPRSKGRVIGYTDEPQVLIEYPDGRKEWWLARLTAVDPGPPTQAAQDRPRRDETPAAGGTDGSGRPDAAQSHLRNPDADRARYSARRATELGGRAGIAEGLAAIAHAILATHPEEPR